MVAEMNTDNVQLAEYHALVFNFPPNTEYSVLRKLSLVLRYQCELPSHYSSTKIPNL